MLRLEGALREIQDASECLAEMHCARDADSYRRSFDRCLGHIRGARWKIRTAVNTAARQEPGRPRVEAAAAWWTAQADTIDSDPVLRWARDTHDAAGLVEKEPTSPDGQHARVGPEGDAVAVRVSVLGPPGTHLGRPVPVGEQTPEGLLAMCIAHCGNTYDRALRAWH